MKAREYSGVVIRWSLVDTLVTGYYARHFVNVFRAKAQNERETAAQIRNASDHALNIFIELRQLTGHGDPLAMM